MRACCLNRPGSCGPWCARQILPFWAWVLTPPSERCVHSPSRTECGRQSHLVSSIAMGRCSSPLRAVDHLRSDASRFDTEDVSRETCCAWWGVLAGWVALPASQGHSESSLGHGCIHSLLCVRCEWEAVLRMGADADSIPLSVTPIDVRWGVRCGCAVWV